MKKKICILTSSRADFGLLKNTINRVNNDKNLVLQLVVSGSHLSRRYGNSLSEIKFEKLKIKRKIQIVGKNDNPEDICNSFSKAINKFSQTFKELKPDCIVFLGDRYEVLAAAYAALIHNIPKIHIHGGESTIGVIDEANRHSISKMSDFHFVSHKTYRKRLIQLGENPRKIFLVGAPVWENLTIIKKKFFSREKNLKLINLKKNDKFFVITLHPITLSKSETKKTITNLLNALNFFKKYKMIFTYPNNDTYANIIINKIKSFSKKNKNILFFKSLGSIKYLSLIKESSCVVGNSSSGLIEAPFFNIPTVNIGKRQKGRVLSASVFSCGQSSQSIKKTITKSLSKKKKINKYLFKIGTKIPSKEICNFIKKTNFKKYDLKKDFFDLHLK